MKKSWIFLSIVALLLLCVFLAALLVAMDGDDQAAEQLEGQQEMDQQAAEQLEEQSSDQPTADQQSGQQEGQSTDQQSNHQTGPSGKSLADLRRALGGEGDLYHGAELDTSEEAVNEMNETGGWILLTRDAPDRVIQFYDRELKGTRDLTKQEGDGGAAYSFRTREGKATPWS